VHESIILLLLPPACIARTNAILLHVYCAIYDAPPTPLMYAIHHTLLLLAISCKGQLPPLCSSAPRTLPPRVNPDAERGNEYDLLFILSLFCEYFDLEYVRFHVISQGSTGGIRYSYSCGCASYVFNI